ncbi:MAG: hypothetical protein IJV86_02705 [Clostridia bacterium]|nr:hypothetical protein [Alphaproteobacteria bacterium]MBQ9737300.1 hypothetical protein [Clostridia bacterium]
MVWYNPFSWWDDERAAPDASEQGRVLQVHDVNHPDSQKKDAAKKAYEASYQNLYNQMDEAWRAQLKQMASNATGQTIIANMPPNARVKIVSPSELGGAGAAYNHETNTFEFSKIDAIGRTGTDGQYDPYMCLVHECRHAMQDHLGYSMIDGKYSAKEAAINGMLIEADAHSVANVETMIMNAFGTSKPTPEQVKNFMKQDLFKKNYPSEVLSQMTPEERAEAQKLLKMEPIYQFQQTLIKNGGNLNKTRQALRRDEFDKYWQKGELSTHYELQTLSNITYQMRRGARPGAENKNRTNQIYEQLAKDHGVSVEEIKKKLKISPAFQQCLDYMAAHPNEKPENLENAFTKIYEANKKQYDLNRDGHFSSDEYVTAIKPLRDPSGKVGSFAQAETSSGGIGGWFRNSWLGRVLGFSDEAPAEATTPEATAAQNSALSNSSNSRSSSAPQARESRGPSDATRALANAGRRYQEQTGIAQQRDGSSRS